MASPVLQNAVMLPATADVEPFAIREPGKPDPGADGPLDGKEVYPFTDADVKKFSAMVGGDNFQKFLFGKVQWPGKSMTVTLMNDGQMENNGEPPELLCEVPICSDLAGAFPPKKILNTFDKLFRKLINARVIVLVLQFDPEERASPKPIDTPSEESHHAHSDIRTPSKTDMDSPRSVPPSPTNRKAPTAARKTPPHPLVLHEGHPKESPRSSRSRHEGKDKPFDKKRDRKDTSQEKRTKDKKHDDTVPQKDGQHSSEESDGQLNGKKGDMREYRAMLASQLEEVMKANAPSKGDTFEKWRAKNGITLRAFCVLNNGNIADVVKELKAGLRNGIPSMPMDVKQRLMDDSFVRGLDLFGKNQLGRRVVDVEEENAEINKMLKKASAKKRKTGEEEGTPRSKRQKTRHSDGDEDADDLDDVKQEDGEEEDAEDGEKEADKTEAEQTHEIEEISYFGNRSKSKRAREDTARGHFNSPMKKPATVTPKKSGPIATLYASMEDGVDMSPGKGDRRRKGSRDDAISSISETVI